MTAQPFTPDVFGTTNADVMDVMRQFVHDRHNIIVSGLRGAGKTTFLNELTSAIADTDRIATVEDSFELDLPHPLVARIVWNNTTGLSAVEQAVRVRPDRIIVDELNGNHALAALHAVTDGQHKGSLFTIHADGAADVVDRLVDMLGNTASLPARWALALISEARPVIIHITRPDGALPGVAEVAVLEPGEPQLRYIIGGVA